MGVRPADGAGEFHSENVTPVDGSPLNVRLEQYEGPFDLLLDLIRRQQIDIYDIPIARITSQYLEFMHQAETMNIDLGGEFVLMAATLIQIKSKMLLPADPVLPGETPEDPLEGLDQVEQAHRQSRLLAFIEVGLDLRV